MTNFATIENKISSARKYLKILERYKKFSKKKIQEDIDIRGALERYLYLAVQSAIDLADATISYKKFRKPTTLSESFYILNEEGIIKNNLTKNMVNMVGFRNIIAHDYEKINYDIVYKILHRGLKDIDDFLKIISEL